MPTLAGGPISPMAARVYGWAAIAAPILLLLSTVTFITEGDGINDGVFGGTIGVWSCFALAVAFAGILRILEPAAPTAAPILTAVGLTGFAAGVAFNVQAIFTAHFGPEIDDFLDTVDGSDTIAILAFLPWGLLTPVTLAATGAVLWRTRSVPRRSAGLLMVGGVLFVASRPARIEPLAVLADCTLVAALAPIGWTIRAPRRRPATPTDPLPAAAT